MKKCTALSFLTITLQLALLIAGTSYSMDSKPRLHPSLQLVTGSRSGTRQLGLAYHFLPKWSIGAHVSTNSYGRDSAYEVERAKGFGAGLNTSFYNSSYDSNSVLVRGRVGLQKLELSESGYQVDDKDSLDLNQLDLDLLGGYQFVWSQGFVLDIQAGLRRSLLDVSHKEYVFRDNYYDIKVFSADNVESAHLILEVGLGFLI